MQCCDWQRRGSMAPADVWPNPDMALASQKQYEAARQVWLQALRYCPNDNTLREYLAELERRRGS